MGTKRLFIALPLPKETLKALGKFRDAMGRDTPYLRWTPVQNLHITALFLGNVCAVNVPRVVETVGRACKDTAPFSLLCRGACYAPRHRPPTMVWLTFDESRSFSECARRLAEALASLAPAMDWKNWKAETPHVTLARFQKSVLPQKRRRLRRTALDGTSIPITSCLLMESHLTPAGPLYRTVKEYLFT